jgi:hypothetical protein
VFQPGGQVEVFPVPDAEESGIFNMSKVRNPLRAARPDFIVLWAAATSPADTL